MELTDDGVALTGVRRILDLEQRLADLTQPATALLTRRAAQLPALLTTRWDGLSDHRQLDTAVDSVRDHLDDDDQDDPNPSPEALDNRRTT